MMKQLNSPLATGGAGYHFEAHIQAAFLILMVSGGRMPGFPTALITKIELQAANRGFHTDDLIVYAEDIQTKTEAKVLCQAKRSISFTEGDVNFSEVIEAAWRDFNDSKFDKDTDKIFLFTGSLSKVDLESMGWILSQARKTASSEEFFRNIELANFTPQKARDKFTILEKKITSANGEETPQRKFI